MTKPWWSAKKSDELGQQLRGVTSRIEKDQAYRVQVSCERLSTYLGRPINSLGDLEGLSSRVTRDNVDSDDFQVPFSQFALDTICARIAGRQRPKPIVLTEGADFETRLQCRKRSKFIEGQFQEKQGEFPTIYDVGVQVFRDSAIFDGGVVKVEIDEASEKVSVKREFPWNVFYDRSDSREGYPNSIYARRSVDCELLCDTYGKQADAIRKFAGNGGDHSYSRMFFGRGTSEESQRVDVWECYAKPTRKGKEGGRRIVICGSEVLVDEPWDRDTFPYVWMIWTRSAVGMYGIPPIEFARRAQTRANYLYDRCYRTTRLLSGGYIDYEPGSYLGDDGGAFVLEANDDVKLMPRLPGKQPATFQMPAPFNPQTLDLADRMKQFVYDAFRTSELTAQGRMEPGVNSGIAIRNRTDLQDLGFLPQARMLEQFWVDVGTQMLYCVNDLARDNGGSVKSVLPTGNGFLESIEWKAIDVGEESLYTVQVKAASATADDYGAKLQYVTELQQMGHIDAGTAQRLIGSGNPDIESDYNRKNAQYNWIERIITEILDSDSEEDAPEVDGPDPYMNLLDAAFQMNQAYLEVSSWPNTPEKKRAQMRQWLDQCIQLINRAKPPAAPPGAPAPGGAPPPMPAPGGPGPV